MKALVLLTSLLVWQSADDFITQGQKILSKQREEAWGLFDKATKADPKHARAWYWRGAAASGISTRRPMAIADYSKAIELDPKNAGAYLGRAGLFQTIDLDHAMADIDKAIEIKPNREAFAARYTIHLDRGERSEATEDLKAIIAVNPNEPQGRANRADILNGLGRFDEALEELNKAIELDAGSSAFYYRRGVAELELKRLDAALADFDKALGITPKYYGAFLRRGDAKRAKGDLAGALADYGECLKLDMKSIEAYHQRGLLLESQGDLDGALADFDKALGDILTQPVEYWRSRARVRKAKGDESGAASDLARALDRELEVLLVSAQQKRGLRCFTKALTNLEKALALQHETGTVLVERALCRTEMREYDAAIADFAAAIEQGATSTLRPWFGMAEAKAQKGDFDGAIAAYDAAIAANEPVVLTARVRKCVVRWKKGEKEGALLDMKKEALSRSSPDAQVELGLMLLDSGDAAGAKAAFDAALKTNYASPVYRLCVARSMVALGDAKGAVRLLGEILAPGERGSMNYAPAWFQRGLAKRAMSDVTADDDIATALALDPFVTESSK